MGDDVLLINSFYYHNFHKEGNMGSRKFLTVCAMVLCTVGAHKQVSAGSVPLPDIEAATATHTNVIILIPDGMGTSHATLSRWVAQSQGKTLAVDQMKTGLCKTYMSNSVIPGSATCGTAFACGYKTSVTRIGVKPDTINVPEVQVVSEEDKFHPIANVMEAAKLMGKKTGVISTSDFRHATPASFVAHWYYRNNGDCIAAQMASSNVDLIFGGGSDKYITNNACLLDNDPLNLGWDTYIDERSELMSLDETAAGRTLGLFADDDLHKDLDRQFFNKSREPSLAEMTERAIDILNEDDDGFVLMVEGSQVDWASHGDDPVGVTTDFLAFDDAVQVARDFASDDGETMVIAVPDHDNGGCTIYSDDNKGGDSYKDIQVHEMVKPITDAKITAAYLADILFGMYPSSDATTADDSAAIADSVGDYWPVIDSIPMSTSEMDEVVDDINNGGWLEKTLGDIFSTRCYIGWTTGGHTGHDVQIWYEGCDRDINTIDNTEVGDMIFEAIGANKDSVNARLFVDATDAFSDADNVTIDTAGYLMSGSNPYIVAGAKLVVEEGSKKGVFFLNTRVCSLYTDTDTSKTVLEEGLVVYEINTHRAFVPKEAVNVFYGGATGVSTSHARPVRHQITLRNGVLNVPGQKHVDVKFYTLNGSMVKNVHVSGSQLNINKIAMSNGVYIMSVNGMSRMKIHRMNGTVN